MRSSTSHRDRQRAGAVLLAGLCLGVGAWLIASPPIVVRLSGRSAVLPDRPEFRPSAAPADLGPPDETPFPAPSRPLQRAAPSTPRRPETWSPPPVATPEVEAPIPPSFPPQPARPRVDLAGVLRAGGLACLGGGEAMLSPSERDLCRERLGAQAERAPSLGGSMAADEPAIYDAARIGAGDDRVRTGKRPRLGCSMRFGPNADRASPEPVGVLRLGPCQIRAGEPNLRKPY